MEKIKKVYIVHNTPVFNPLQNIRYTTKQYKKKSYIVIKTLFVKIFYVKNENNTNNKVDNRTDILNPTK